MFLNRIMELMDSWTVGIAYFENTVCGKMVLGSFFRQVYRDQLLIWHLHYDSRKAIDANAFSLQRWHLCHVGIMFSG